MTSLRDAKKEQARDNLARAAAEIFVHDGEAAMTVAAIADRAGVSTRTFYNYFASREDALLEAVSAVFLRWADALAVSSEPTPLSAVIGLVREEFAGPGDTPESLTYLVPICDYIVRSTGVEGQNRRREVYDELIRALRGRYEELTDATANATMSAVLAIACAVIDPVRYPPGASPPGEAGERFDAAVAWVSGQFAGIAGR